MGAVSVVTYIGAGSLRALRHQVPPLTAES